jgi:hypothetical protein
MASSTVFIRAVIEFVPAPFVRNSEAEYFKINPPKCNFTKKCENCESFKKLFLKLKECKEQCFQLRQHINFVRQHRLHQKINQIKSVDTKLKTGIPVASRSDRKSWSNFVPIKRRHNFKQFIAGSDRNCT